MFLPWFYPSNRIPPHFTWNPKSIIVCKAPHKSPTSFLPLSTPAFLLPPYWPPTASQVQQTYSHHFQSSFFIPYLCSNITFSEAFLTNLLKIAPFLSLSISLSSFTAFITTCKYSWPLNIVGVRHADLPPGRQKSKYNFLVGPPVPRFLCTRSSTSLVSTNHGSA